MAPKMLIDEGDRFLGFNVYGAEPSGLLAAARTEMPGRLPFTAPRDALFAHPTAAAGLSMVLAKDASRS